MYHDIDPRDAKLWCSKLKLQSYAALTDVARSPAYKNIPSAYLVCEDDRAIPVEGQDNMIEEARKDGAVIEVERLFVAHSPYLNKPDAVAAFLRRAAGEEVK
jgi:pimeloyl-ACP methyl ester carboxylesterase